MTKGSLRKVGGSVMLTVPPALLERLGLRAGQTVQMDVRGGGLVVTPLPRPRYRLEELLAQCDPAAEGPQDDGWLGDPAAGQELL